MSFGVRQIRWTLAKANKFRFTWTSIDHIQSEQFKVFVRIFRRCKYIDFLAIFRFDLQHVPANVTDYMNKVNEIFLKNIRKGCRAHCTSTVANDEVFVHIIVHSNEINLSWETNESYRLDIVSKVDHQVIVQIDAFTVFGARHGLETLSQLIAADDGDTEQSSGLLLVASARIEDRPVYRHRGLMLDTARNYLPISAIERTINGMGASKLNVFHWHITDSQSFPLEIPSVPQLTRYGAYSPHKIYSPDNVRHIVEYAKLRGVRVIIEIDAPSHAGLFCKYVFFAFCMPFNNR